MLDELGKGGKTHERAQAAQELDHVNGTDRDAYPGLPADYFVRRLEDLDKRGDIVRSCRETATELYRSLIDDIHSGRMRSVVIHFRPFADWCLACLFCAYAATSDELDRRSLPNDAVVKAARILEHWGRPVDPENLKKLRTTLSGSSQAVHGSLRAAEEIDGWAAKSGAQIEGATKWLMQAAEEADRRLNGHRRQASRLRWSRLPLRAPIRGDASKKESLQGSNLSS